MEHQHAYQTNKLKCPTYLFENGWDGWSAHRPLNGSYGSVTYERELLLIFYYTPSQTNFIAKNYILLQCFQSFLFKMNNKWFNKCFKHTHVHLQFQIKHPLAKQRNCIVFSKFRLEFERLTNLQTTSHRSCFNKEPCPTTNKLISAKHTKDTSNQHLFYSIIKKKRNSSKNRLIGLKRSAKRSVFNGSPIKPLSDASLIRRWRGSPLAAVVQEQFNIQSKGRVTVAVICREWEEFLKMRLIK